MSRELRLRCLNRVFNMEYCLHQTVSQKTTWTIGVIEKRVNHVTNSKDKITTSPILNLIPHFPFLENFNERFNRQRYRNPT